MPDQQGLCAKCRKRAGMAVIATGKTGGGLCHKCFQKGIGTMQNIEMELPWRSWKEGFEEWLRIEQQNGRFKDYGKDQAYKPV